MPSCDHTMFCGIALSQCPVLTMQSNMVDTAFTCVCCCFRFFAINTLVVYLYFSSFQKIDEEEYGGFTEILKEGLMTSFSSFLVS